MASDSKDRQETIAVVTRNWQAEVETAQTYRDLAEREHDEKRKAILLRMAEAEERHAQRWEKKLRDLGAEPPVFKETIVRRLNRWWNRFDGAEISRERAEVEENPEEEIEEMSLFYQLQGFTPEESQKMAERLAQQPE